MGYWKQMLYYCFRTGLMDGEMRERVHGIQFTREQERLMIEISSLLQVYDDKRDVDDKDDEEWESSEEESDQDEEVEDEHGTENEDQQPDRTR